MKIALIISAFLGFAGSVQAQCSNGSCSNAHPSLASYGNVWVQPSVGIYVPQVVPDASTSRVFLATHTVVFVVRQPRMRIVRFFR